MAPIGFAALPRGCPARRFSAIHDAERLHTRGAGDLESPRKIAESRLRPRIRRRVTSLSSAGFDDRRRASFHADASISCHPFGLSILMLEASLAQTGFETNAVLLGILLARGGGLVRVFCSRGAVVSFEYSARAWRSIAGYFARADRSATSLASSYPVVEREHRGGRASDEDSRARQREPPHRSFDEELRPSPSADGGADLLFAPMRRAGPADKTSTRAEVLPRPASTPFLHSLVG